MPYLDEDILYNNVEEKYKVAKGKAREAYSDVLDTICEMPRADVVPKSEVDEIIGAFDTWLYKHYNGDISDWDLYKLFAELKNKYKENENGKTNSNM